jgi:hypothetical protein
MADIRVPKEHVTKFAASYASKVATAGSDLERRGFIAIRDDPGRAMIAILMPYLKGDILRLSLKYGYGDMEVEDPGDGYYHMEIPDEFISKTMPAEFGQAERVSPKATQERREGLLEDLVTATIPLVNALDKAPGTTGEKTRRFVETASEAFGRITGSQVTTDEVMGLQAERARQVMATQQGPGLEEVKQVLDRLADRMEDDDKVLFVTSMLRMVGQDARTKDKFLQNFVGFACVRLGVEWDQATGRIAVDQAGSVKRVMFDAVSAAGGKAPEKKKHWWQRSPKG